MLAEGSALLLGRCVLSVGKDRHRRFGRNRPRRTIGEKPLRPALVGVTGGSGLYAVLYFKQPGERNNLDASFLSQALADDGLSQCRKPDGNRQTEMGSFPSTHSSIEWGARDVKAIRTKVGRRNRRPIASKRLGHGLAGTAVPNARA